MLVRGTLRKRGTIHVRSATPFVEPRVAHGMTEFVAHGMTEFVSGELSVGLAQLDTHTFGGPLFGRPYQSFTFCGRLIPMAAGIEKKAWAKKPRPAYDFIDKETSKREAFSAANRLACPRSASIIS